MSVGCKFSILTYAPGTCSLALFYYIFVNSCKENDNFNNLTFVNPFSLIVIIGAIPLMIFVGTFAYKQTGLVARRLTIKQYESITREMFSGKKVEEGYRIKRKMPLREKMSNIWIFIKKSTPTSLFSGKF